MGGLLRVKFRQSDAKAVILDRILFHRKLELAKTSCPARLAAGRFSLRMHALRTARSQDLTRPRMAFPKENDSHRHDLYFLFFVPNPSAVRRLSTALTCVDSTGRRNASPGSVLHRHYACTIITHVCGILKEKSLT